MDHSHDDRIRALRTLQDSLAVPAISPGSIQKALLLLVDEAIQVREALKEIDGGQF